MRRRIEAGIKWFEVGIGAVSENRAGVFGQRIELLDENDLSTAEGDGTTVGAQLGV